MKKKISKTRSLDFDLSSMKDLPKLTFLEEHILSKHQIILSDLKYEDQIGRGGSAKVYLGEYKGKIVCIKELLKVRINIQRYRIQFQREIVQMSKLNHPNILKFFGSSNIHFVENKRKRSEEEGRILYLCEYIPCGSLYNILKEKKIHIDNIRNHNTKVNIIREIGLGIEYLHENGCIHGDLKSMNILLKEDMKPIICDFGFLQKLRRKKGEEEESGDWRNQVIYQDPRGTIYWMAPECVRDDKKSYICQKSDIWSFGVIMWEIVTESKPYPDFNPLEVKELLPKRKIKLNLEGIRNEKLRKLIKMCLCFDTSDRSSIFEVNEFIRNELLS